MALADPGQATGSGSPGIEGVDESSQEPALTVACTSVPPPAVVMTAGVAAKPVMVGFLSLGFPAPATDGTAAAITAVTTNTRAMLPRLPTRNTSASKSSLRREVSAGT